MTKLLDAGRNFCSLLVTACGIARLAARPLRRAADEPKSYLVV